MDRIPFILFYCLLLLTISIICFQHFNFISQSSNDSGASDIVPTDYISPVLNDAIESEEELDSSSDQDECDYDLKIDPLDHPSQIFTESNFLETENMHNESMKKHVSTYNEDWRQIQEIKG